MNCHQLHFFCHRLSAFGHLLDEGVEKCRVTEVRKNHVEDTP